MIKIDNIVELGVGGLAHEFRRGRLSPVTATEFYLAQIALFNPTINAVLETYRSEALAAARASALRYKSSRPLSEIDGVPIGVKANIAVAGHICHGGIKAYENNRAESDAEVVKRLKDAGAVIIASLNMEEGALGAATDNPWFGKTYNPLKQGYTPGGSSGGSAAAVAAGMLPAALGTDTMGSVRIPSAYCGLVGHKPTYDLVPMDGVMLLSPTLDHVGPHTRTIEDAVVLIDVLAGKKISGAEANLTDITIGVLDWGRDVDVEPAIEKGIASLVDKLGKLRTSVKPIKLEGYDFGRVRRAGLLVSEVEGAEVHVSQYEKHPEGFSDHFQSLLTWGVRQSIEKADKAYVLIDQQKQRAKDIFSECDVLIAPTAPQRAFKFGDPIPANQADFTAFANFAGLPATAIPIEMGKKRLPASVQIIGPKGSDGLTLSVAAKLAELT